MEGPRAPVGKEFPRILEFLDENLRPNVDWSIAAEYPLALHQNNIHNIRIITEEEEVLSHAVLRPVIMKTPMGLFKVAAIGSVVTSSQHRNRGLSQRIMQDCLQAAHDQLCDFAILWTNIYDFYRKFGFELAGTEYKLTFYNELQIEDPNLRILDTAQVSPEAIHRLYNQHSVCSMRNLEETAKYLQIPNSRIYTAWDSFNRLQAYAVEGKGADMHAHIHEWGGGVSKILPLISHIRKVQARPITAMVGPQSQALLRKSRELGVEPLMGYLGMIRILHPEQLFNKVRRHARSVGISDLILEKRDNNYYLGTPDHLFKTDMEADMIRLLFGPVKASQLAKLDAHTTEILERVLPIPMWVWGWDSI